VTPPESPAPLLEALHRAREATHLLVRVVPDLSEAFDRGARVLERSVANIERGGLTPTSASLIATNVAVVRASILHALGRRAARGNTAPVHEEVASFLGVLRDLAHQIAASGSGGWGDA